MQRQPHESPRCLGTNKEKKSNPRSKASCFIHWQKRVAAKKSFHKSLRCYSTFITHRFSVLAQKKSYLMQFCPHLALLVVSEMSLFIGNVLKSEHAWPLLLFVRAFRISSVCSIINRLLLNMTDGAMGFTGSSFMHQIIKLKNIPNEWICQSV